MRILLFAYACEPNRGSEPGVGWNLAIELAQVHEVWVLTRANNRHAIEAATGSHEIHWIYHDLPAWLRWWKRGHRGVQLYYYLWQRSARRIGRDLTRQENIELVHHVTFVKYWSPSAAATGERPFVWGPVGGGERLPKGFWRGLSWQARIYEVVRFVVQRVSEIDPAVTLTARSSSVALCTTGDTAARVCKMGAGDVRVLSEAAMSSVDIDFLGSAVSPRQGQLRIVYMGRLIGWKGVHLAIEALSKTETETATLTVIGDGPERTRLTRLANQLGVQERVVFAGAVSRADALGMLRAADALIHPSLHDSGGWVCLEGMAAGKPIICLDWAGPGVQVGGDCGIKVAVTSQVEVIAALATAIRDLAGDRELCAQMGAAGRVRVRRDYSWPMRVRFLNEVYREVLAAAPKHARQEM